MQSIHSFTLYDSSYILQGELAGEDTLSLCVYSIQDLQPCRKFISVLHNKELSEQLVDHLDNVRTVTEILEKTKDYTVEGGKIIFGIKMSLPNGKQKIKNIVIELVEAELTLFETLSQKFNIYVYSAQKREDQLRARIQLLQKRQSHANQQNPLDIQSLMRKNQELFQFVERLGQKYEIMESKLESLNKLQSKSVISSHLLSSKIIPEGIPPQAHQVIPPQAHQVIPAQVIPHKKMAVEAPPPSPFHEYCAARAQYRIEGRLCQHTTAQWGQLLLKARAKGKTSIRMRLLETESRNVGLGVIDSKLWGEKYSWNNKKGMIWYNGRYSGVMDSGVVAKTEGDGFKEGEVVSLHVDTLTGRMEWRVGAEVRASYMSANLKDPSIEWVFFILMKVKGDTAEILQN